MWFWLKLALDILGFWVALSIVTGILWGVIASRGWRPYWRNLSSLWKRNPPFEEYGDLSEGR